MIRTNINTNFPHHLSRCLITNNTIYVADYTEKTKYDRIKRGTELFDNTYPVDIDYFTVNNVHNLEINAIPFDNRSFVRSGGGVASQCECVIYPHTSDVSSWICFIELKYSNQPKNNIKNINKARLQLFRTQYYYRSKGIFGNSNPCYLIASLPIQSPPFANISLTPGYLLDMKRKHNIIIRYRNSVEIINNTELRV